MKSGVSPQKLRNYGWITPISVNFLGAQSSLGDAQILFGGAQALIWGHTAPECPPMVPGLNLLSLLRAIEHRFKYAK